ncbi:MAG: protein kinase, partial [Maribacter sp.]|nr:protein kinase [Maribacter sp.]
MSESLIYESSKSRIYMHEESEWGIPIALKVLNIEYPSPGDIEDFYNEFEIIEDLKLSHGRNVLKRSRDQNRHAMYLEWYDGATVKNVFKNKQGDLVDFLHIAIATSEALHELHVHNIIHKDLNPHNVLVNLQKHEIKIIDFGISTKFDLKQHHTQNPEHLDGTLAYISPEQTGRMNRKVDYRTDLYSLGVMLYEMVTGKLPFNSEDALELVHC